MDVDGIASTLPATRGKYKRLTLGMLYAVAANVGDDKTAFGQYFYVNDIAMFELSTCFTKRSAYSGLDSFCPKRTTPNPS